jgi:hypothetical protein
MPSVAMVRSTPRFCPLLYFDLSILDDEHRVAGGAFTDNGRVRRIDPLPKFRRKLLQVAILESAEQLRVLERRNPVHDSAHRDILQGPGPRSFICPLSSTGIVEVFEAGLKPAC